MPPDARAKALSALARFQVIEATVGETLERIAYITREAVEGAAAVGITMLDQNSRPTTAVFTDNESPEIDAAQYRENKGPCLDAWRHQRAFRLDHVVDWADEYPGFVDACQARGVHSTLSLPIPAGKVAMGALNIYACAPGAFSSDGEALATDLAGAAGSVLANVSAYRSAIELTEQLNEAMASRAVIEQAKGMLMAQDPKLDPDAAFDLLRRASQRENVKLREIAARIVERRLAPSSEISRP